MVIEHGLIRQNISLETSLPPDALGRVFAGLVRSLSMRYPKLVKDTSKTIKQIKLNELEKAAIRRLNTETNPKKLMETILEQPPLVYAVMNDTDPENTMIFLGPPKKITIIKPSKSDIKITKNHISFPETLDDNQRMALNLIVKSCINYLKAPKIVDGFSEKNINRRGLWVLGLSQALHQIALDESNIHHYNWDPFFQEIWNNNRYAGTKRDAVYMNFSVIGVIIMPSEIQTKINLIIEELEKSKQIFKNGSVDEATDIIAEQCRNFILFFTEK